MDFSNTLLDQENQLQLPGDNRIVSTFTFT
jgi:hypothetical protein